MHFVLYFVLMTSGAFAQNENFPLSKFYEDTDVYEYSCSVEFSRRMQFDCACVSGLWLLYDSCNDKNNITISGENLNCQILSAVSVTRAVQLLKNTNEVALLKPDGSVQSLQPDRVSGISISNHVTLIAGADWTLVEPTGTRICLSAAAEPNSYCFFSNKDDSSWSLENIERGCEYYDYFVDPDKCQPISEGNRWICQSEGEQKRLYKRDTESDQRDTDSERVQEKDQPVKENHQQDMESDQRDTDSERVQENDQTVKENHQPVKKNDQLVQENHQRVQENNQQENDQRNKAHNRQKGRVFFGGVGNQISESNKTENITGLSGNSTVWVLGDDEDFFNATSENKTKEADGIATEIWNFVDIKLDKILGLEKPTTSDTKPQQDVTRGRSIIEKELSSIEAKLNITYSNPLYEFLDVSKRVMQKTCPPYYVKPEFIDLAVSAFIKIQQTHFKFPETTFRPPAFRRVLEALRLCEKMSARFNFTEGDCAGKVFGNFTAFGGVVEMTITDEWAPPDRDPIVETVWKVFFNAHSSCFSYFNKTFNDHHRFTTWMMPLFQNQMNDLWTQGKTSENSLSGLFGNQVEVQANLAYCAASSRLESKYPWDLPRPARVEKYGKAMNFTSGRRKREADYYTDFAMPAYGTCLDPKRPMLCSYHS